MSERPGQGDQGGGAAGAELRSLAEHWGTSGVTSGDQDHSHTSALPQGLKQFPRVAK